MMESYGLNVHILLTESEQRKAYRYAKDRQGQVGVAVGEDHAGEGQGNG